MVKLIKLSKDEYFIKCDECKSIMTFGEEDLQAIAYGINLGCITCPNCESKIYARLKD